MLSGSQDRTERIVRRALRLVAQTGGGYARHTAP